MQRKRQSSLFSSLSSQWLLLISGELPIPGELRVQNFSNAAVIFLSGNLTTAFAFQIILIHLTNVSGFLLNSLFDPLFALMTICSNLK